MALPVAAFKPHTVDDRMVDDALDMKFMRRQSHDVGMQTGGELNAEILFAPAILFGMHKFCNFAIAACNTMLRPTFLSCVQNRFLAMSSHLPLSPGFH